MIIDKLNYSLEKVYFLRKTLMNKTASNLSKFVIIYIDKFCKHIY